MFGMLPNCFSMVAVILIHPTFMLQSMDSTCGSPDQDSMELEYTSPITLTIVETTNIKHITSKGLMAMYTLMLNKSSSVMFLQAKSSHYLLKTFKYPLLRKTARNSSSFLTLRLECFRAEVGPIDSTQWLMSRSLIILFMILINSIQAIWSHMFE